MTPRVAITSAGVISPIGAGVSDFTEALYAGKSGIGESALIAGGAAAAQVPDFQPQAWLGNKGIRMLDRSSRLLCVAAQMTLENNTNLVQASGQDGDPEVGLVCGTMFGSVHSIASFDWSGLCDGPTYVNPMEFPNTVINSPAGQAAIKHRLAGVNSTICAGLASGLHALQYAAESLRFGRARAILAGGVDELCEETIRGFRRIGLSSGYKPSRPFDPASGGGVPGEASALMLLERPDDAQQRGATPIAEIVGFGCSHSAGAIGHYQLLAESATEAIQDALTDARIAPEQIACVVAAANGFRASDVMETKALRNIFNGHLKDLPVCAPKAACGESMGASGAIGALTAVTALKRQCAPPTAGFRHGNSWLRLSAEPQPFQGDYALVNGFSCDGINAALVIKLWKN